MNWGYIIWSVIALSFFIIGVAILWKGKTASDKEVAISIFMVIFSLLIGMVTGMAWSSEVTSETEHTDVYQLQAASYQTHTEGEMLGSSLFFAGKGYIGEREVYKWVRVTEDEQGENYSSIITEDVHKVRVYQKDGEQPVERRHYKTTEQRNGHRTTKLTQIDLVLPAGSIIESFKIDINENSSDK